MTCEVPLMNQRMAACLRDYLPSPRFEPFAEDSGQWLLMPLHGWNCLSSPEQKLLMQTRKRVRNPVPQVVEQGPHGDQVFQRSSSPSPLDAAPNQLTDGFPPPPPPPTPLAFCASADEASAAATLTEPPTTEPLLLETKPPAADMGSFADWKAFGKAARRSGTETTGPFISLRCCDTWRKSMLRSEATFLISNDFFRIVMSQQ